WAALSVPQRSRRARTSPQRTIACHRTGSAIRSATSSSGRTACSTSQPATATLSCGAGGMLSVAPGDGASYSSVDPLALRAQDIDRLAGKILRINPANGQGGATNPFTGCNPGCNLTASRSKVWAYGVRNDFRFNFKPGTNTIL